MKSLQNSYYFNLIKKRTKIVEQMLKLKKYKNQIIDHKRINEMNLPSYEDISKHNKIYGSENSKYLN